MDVTACSSEEWKQRYYQLLNRVHIKMYRKAVKILISVVIGALLLAGLYALMEGTVLPELQQRISEMFEYNG